MSMLRLAGISKCFGDKQVLDGLSFVVERGEVYGLLGPNGCGKSTAINIICNLLDADRGTVEIAGRAASAVSKQVVGICPQEIALYRDLYPGENLRFFARLHGMTGAAQDARVAELMTLFALAPFAHTRVAALSGGWQRRVNIAVALIHSPDILILDEPTSAVDLEARHDLWQMIEMLKKTGMTILLTTHHLDEAEQLCSRVGIMKNGRLAREGTIFELLALVPAKAIAMVDATDEDSVVRRAMELGWATRRYAGKLGCLLPQQVSLREVVDAFNGIDLSSIGLQRVSLEHAYLEVIHTQSAETGARDELRLAA
jgi:ABC-2 type transport system ATP-binding protein